MKLELQETELRTIKDLIEGYLDNKNSWDPDGYKIRTNIGAAITNRITRETLLVNIKELNTLGKVEFTITNEQDELEEQQCIAPTKKTINE